MTRFSERIKEYLELHDLNILQFSKIIGIPNSMISRYLFGTVPNLEILIKLSDFMECSIEFLLGRTDHEKYTKSTLEITFKERFVALKLDKKISAKKLSKILGVSDTTVGYWCKEQMPDTNNLIVIADYFGVTIDYLAGREK